MTYTEKELEIIRKLQEKNTKRLQREYYLKVTKPNRAKKRKEKEKTIPVDTL